MGPAGNEADRTMVFPRIASAPEAIAEMPENARADFNEARLVLPSSARAAAALLRLAIQRLCVHLDEKGENLNDDIASLVGKGLPQTIQQALDVVRVVGNHAVHPGTMDLRDDEEVARRLFALVNLITQVMIVQPKEVKKLYAALPERDRKAIEKRDGAKPPTT